MLQGFWLLIGIAVPAAVLGLGVAAVVVFEMRHPDMPGLVLAGYVFYLGFFPVIYAFWIWAMGRGHAWKWWLWLFLALGLLVIGLTGPGNFIEVAQPVIGFAGLVWFASGAGTLLLYLRHHPRPLPEAE
jgi:hypothetical protein